MKNNLIEDEILSIEIIDEVITYDIEVDSEDHLFFANGILTHNSGFDASEIVLNNISESAGLAHTVDLIYAIIQDPQMRANKEYWLKILKMRDGDGVNVKCRHTVDYEHMTIVETGDVIKVE